MAPRKATYTPEEAKARQQSARKQYDEKNMTVVKVKMQIEDKAIFEQYAKYKGLALARMFRQCAETCMRLDGWAYQPEAGQGAEAQAGEGEEDQPGEQAQQ